MKVMVVDDSSVIRTKIQNVLSTEKYEIVGTAGNGYEAIVEFQKYKPTVMTMDITMPEMDGIATIKEILAFDSEVRILVVSALADKATLIEAMTLGAYGFLCKPFTDSQLAEAIEELIEDL